jgi:hypothetical protein
MLGRMKQRLSRTWGVATAIPFVLALAAQVLRETGVLPPLLRGDSPTVAMLLLCLAATGGIAAPMMYRILFARAHRERETVPPDALFRFENNGVVLASSSAWCLLVVILLGLPQLYTSAILLLAMYAAYTHFPSERRLSSDAQLFRVRL